MANRIIRLQDIVEEVQKHHPEADTVSLRRLHLSAKAMTASWPEREPYCPTSEVAYHLAKMGLGPSPSPRACSTTRWRTPPPPWTI